MELTVPKYYINTAQAHHFFQLENGLPVKCKFRDHHFYTDVDLDILGPGYDDTTKKVILQNQLCSYQCYVTTSNIRIKDHEELLDGRYNKNA